MLALVVAAVSSDTASCGEVPSHVCDASPCAGVVCTLNLGQELTLWQSEVAPALVVLTTLLPLHQVVPFRVTELLSESYTVLIAERQTRRVPSSNDTVRKGVMAQ